MMITYKVKDIKETGICKSQGYKVWTGEYPSLTSHLSHTA